eukprot:1153521-Pelagomonas_calceolata.AAC.7
MGSTGKMLFIQMGLLLLSCQLVGLTACVCAGCGSCLNAHCGDSPAVDCAFFISSGCVQRSGGLKSTRAQSVVLGDRAQTKVSQFVSLPLLLTHTHIHTQAWGAFLSCAKEDWALMWRPRGPSTSMMLPPQPTRSTIPRRMCVCVINPRACAPPCKSKNAIGSLCQSVAVPKNGEHGNHQACSCFLALAADI